MEGVVGDFPAASPAGGYPDPAGFAEHHVLGPGYGYGAEFDHGPEPVPDGPAARPVRGP
ncbi:hypothetical protein ACIPW5_00230 [Streptomyces sp. NPDC090077]|uniref:hypothetical protein n=1 Tax=Streptomyces sp. NPDC090077 TaxID=3365938 RepID=UPI0037FB8B7C